MAVAIVLATAACGSSEPNAAVSTPTAVSFDVGKSSAETPPDAATLAAAEREGTVVLYTNGNDTQIAPLTAGFKELYPGIRVQALSLSAPEVFQRYLSESATGARTADVIINSDATSWIDFVGRGGVADYTDPNVANLPQYAQLLPGVVAMSEDPLIAVYNKKVLPAAQQPATLAALAEQAPQLKGKIGTYAVENPLGYGGTYEYLSRQKDQGWSVLDKLAGSTTAEDSAGTMLTKLAQGQYAALFNMSGAARSAITTDYAQLMDFKYLSDATPLLPRGIAVTAKAASPNAAKVFTNYVLSVRGQQAACKGGFTPYRGGVDCPFGVPAIAATIGAENVVPGTYSKDTVSARQDITARWNKAFKR